MVETGLQSTACADELLSHQEQDQIFQQIFDGVQAGIVIIDKATHVIVSVNAKAAELIGCDKRRIIGNVCHNFICPAEAGKCPISDLGHRVDNAERTLITYSGEILPILKTVTRIALGGKDYIVDSFVDISGQASILRDLKESEERFRTIFESSTDAMMTLEPPTWKFTSGNGAALRMFSVENIEKFLEMNPADVSPPKQRDGENSAEKAMKMIQGAMESGTNSFEWIHNRNDGEEFYADILLTRLEQGGRKFIHATVRDITEFKSSEDALFKTLAELRTIYENIPSVLVMVDRERCVTKLNRAAALFAGTPEDEIMSRRLGEALGCLNSLDDSRGCGSGPNCGECAIRLAILNAFETGECAKNKEHWLPFLQEGKSVRRRLQFSTAYLEINATGNVLLCAQDVTEFRNAAIKLHESEKKYRMLSENSSDVIWSMGFDGRLQYVSQSVEKLRGFKSEEAMRQDLSQMLMAESIRYFEAEIVKILDSLDKGEDIPNRIFQVEQPCKDGSTVWTEVSAGLLRDDQGAPIGILGVSRDISERRKVEDELKATLAVLERYKKVTVERELRMIELKGRIKGLEAGNGVRA